ncbi:MAG TPA: Fe-S cluster assembly protein SufD [Acidobacteriota bacterium]|nr:Fe-S cluster assembly protein SufD [Acidobacteriota bacterium]
MLEAVKEETTDFLALFSNRSQPSPQEPLWLQKMRRDGIRTFQEIGFPSTRDEAWKYTDISPIAQTEWNIPQAADARLTEEGLARIQFSNLSAARWTFVNGVFMERLSSRGALPEAVRVSTLAQAQKECPELLERHLARYASREEPVFHALNLAFLQDAALIHVPPGLIVEEPIQLIFCNVPGGRPHMTSPRVLIVAEENSQVSVLETHLTTGSGVYFTNTVTEVFAGDNSVVDHYKVQRESDEAFHMGTVHLHQQRNANVRTNTVSLSGAIIRNETNTILDGEGGWGELNGLFLISKDHHVDNFTRLEHRKPHCDSREVYKGVLEDQAKGIFRGRIVVAKGAQKTDSKQTNNNLLLSNEALIHTKPQLEIYADDVKCTHGATIGQLDRDALFYLRARGIDEKAARSILIYAFASEMVNKVRIDALRKELDDYLFEWLPRGELVREAV